MTLAIGLEEEYVGKNNKVIVSFASTLPADGLVIDLFKSV